MYLFEFLICKRQQNLPDYNLYNTHLPEELLYENIIIIITCRETYYRFHSSIIVVRFKVI